MHVTYRVSHSRMREMVLECVRYFRSSHAQSPWRDPLRTDDEMAQMVDAGMTWAAAHYQSSQQSVMDSLRDFAAACIADAELIDGTPLPWVADLLEQRGDHRAETLRWIIATPDTLLPGEWAYTWRWMRSECHANMAHCHMGIGSGWSCTRVDRETWEVNAYGRRHSLANWCPPVLLDEADAQWQADTLLRYESQRDDVAPTDCSLDPEPPPEPPLWSEPIHDDADQWETALPVRARRA